MDLELRLENDLFINNIIKFKPNSVSIGNDGCIYQIPSGRKLEKIINQLLQNNIIPRVVTPRVNQANFTKIENIIKVIKKYPKKIDIVVNDLGVLEYCREYKDILSIYLGRQIVRSLTDSPWFLYILKNENSNIQDGLLYHSFDHSSKIELLKNLGIVGIEPGNIHDNTLSIFNIQKKGIKVRVDLSKHLLTVGNNCVTSRYYKKIPPKCINDCKNYFSLTWDSLWIGPTLSDRSISDEHNACLPEIFVKGNRVLINSKNSIHDSKKINAEAVIYTVEKNITENEKNEILYIKEQIK